MPTVDQLCRVGSEYLAIHRDAPAADIVSAFQQMPNLRLLPVLDEREQPIGAIFEEDVRQILFNPYGHALLRNPSFARSLAERVRPCPTADIGCGLRELLGIYAEAEGKEGMILTRAGRYCGFIENRDLIQAAGAHERDRIRRREAQLQRLRTIGEAFEREVRDLAAGLASVADGLGGTAAATAERGEATGRRAGAVATAAGQTGDVIRQVAGHGRDLADALDALHEETIQANAAAREAVRLVAAGTQRADALLASATSIEGITGLIDGLSKRVQMLAINATIEAARAGEAGRGFAIVAGEVRNRAGQTHAAAVDIQRHAIDVRHAVDDVVLGHDGIERVVSGVERISRTVDATVDAQQVMTRNIAVGADQAADASRDIQANVDAIFESAQSAAHGALDMATAADRLGTSSRGLTDRVAAFLDDIRAIELGLETL